MQIVLSEWMVFVIGALIGFLVTFLHKYATMFVSRKMVLSEVSDLMQTSVKGLLFGLLVVTFCYLIGFDILDQKVYLSIFSVIIGAEIMGKDVSVSIKDYLVKIFKFKMGIMTPDEKDREIKRMQDARKQVIELLENKIKEIEIKDGLLKEYIKNFGDLPENSNFELVKENVTNTANIDNKKTDEVEEIRTI